MNADLETYDREYSLTRLKKTAKTFRKLGETYEDIQGKGQAVNIISNQLFVLADVINQCCEDQTKIVRLGKLDRAGMLKTMLIRGVKIKWMKVMERNAGRREIVVMAKTAKHNCVMVRELTAAISGFYKCEFYSSEKNRSIVNEDYCEYTFVEEPRFRLLSGIAKSNKDKMDISGDNFSIIQLDCGRDIITIADGMGAGKTAFCESETVIELMEECLEAGFEEKVAIGLINSAFSAGTFISNPVAVDMCVIDRHLGVLNCIKLGAASTFIKRDGWVEIIKSTTLPIGVLEQVDYDNAVKKLYDGDYVVMISDGILENLPVADKEGKLVEIINSIEIKQPEAIANQILEEALKLNQMIAKDDMTVIVAGVFDTRGKVY